METGLTWRAGKPCWRSSRNSRGSSPNCASGEPGGPAVRRRAGGQDAGPQTGRQAQGVAAEEKNPRRKRQQGFVRLRMEPAAQVTHAPELPRMPYCPERGLGAADPGGHRTSGVSCRKLQNTSSSPGGVRCAGDGGCPRTTSGKWPWAGSGGGSTPYPVRGRLWSARLPPCGRKAGCP